MFSVLWGISTLFAVIIVLIYIPTNSVQAIPLLLIFILALTIFSLLFSLLKSSVFRAWHKHIGIKETGKFLLKIYSFLILTAVLCVTLVFFLSVSFHPVA